MNIKKLVSLLTCGFTVLGASFNSMAMKESDEPCNENTNLIDTSVQRGPGLHDFTENMLEECKTKNKKMYRVPYNDRWLLVNGDLSPFRMGTEKKNSDQNFFYYSVSDSDNNLKKKIEKHPVQPSSDNAITFSFKLPLPTDSSKSLIVTYVVGWPLNGVTYSYGSGSDQFDTNFLKNDKECLKQYIQKNLEKGVIAKIEYIKKLMDISGKFKSNKNYLFQTKNLFFLEDIRNESEESQIGRWFKENKDEIESYANKNGFPLGKTVGKIGAAILLEELIRRNLPKNIIEENFSDSDLEQEKLTDHEIDLDEIETDDED